MDAIWKLFSGMRTLLKLMGAACLVGMTFLTCADVVGRYLGHPIFGSVELVGFMATLAAALALPYTHEMRGHIGVEIFVQTLSEKTQTIIDVCTNFVALVLFAVVTWRMFLYAGTIRRSGEVSMSLEFPEHVIITITAVCFLFFALTIVEEIVKTIKPVSYTHLTLPTN